MCKLPVLSAPFVYQRANFRGGKKSDETCQEFFNKVFGKRWGPVKKHFCLQHIISRLLTAFPLPELDYLKMESVQFSEKSSHLLMN